MDTTREITGSGTFKMLLRDSKGNVLGLLLVCTDARLAQKLNAFIERGRRMIVTHAFTLCPLYAEAILSYGKNVENRSWRLLEDFIGVPIALHVGKRNPMLAELTIFAKPMLKHLPTSRRTTCPTAASSDGYGSTVR